MEWKELATGSNAAIYGALIRYKKVSDDGSLFGRIKAFLNACDLEYFRLHSVSVVESDRAGKLNYLFVDLFDVEAELVRFFGIIKNCKVDFSFHKSSKGIDIHYKYTDTYGFKKGILKNLRSDLKQIKKNMQRIKLTSSDIIENLSHVDVSKYRRESFRELLKEINSHKINIDAIYSLTSDYYGHSYTIEIEKKNKLLKIEVNSCISYYIYTFKHMSVSSMNYRNSAYSLEEALLKLYEKEKA